MYNIPYDEFAKTLDFHIPEQVRLLSKDLAIKLFHEFTNYESSSEVIDGSSITLDKIPIFAVYHNLNQYKCLPYYTHLYPSWYCILKRNDLESRDWIKHIEDFKIMIQNGFRADKTFHASQINEFIKFLEGCKDKFNDVVVFLENIENNDQTNLGTSKLKCLIKKRAGIMPNTSCCFGQNYISMLAQFLLEEIKVDKKESSVVTQVDGVTMINVKNCYKGTEIQYLLTSICYSLLLYKPVLAQFLYDFLCFCIGAQYEENYRVRALGNLLNRERSEGTILFYELFNDKYNTEDIFMDSKALMTDFLDYLKETQPNFITSSVGDVTYTGMINNKLFMASQYINIPYVYEPDYDSYRSIVKKQLEEYTNSRNKIEKELERLFYERKEIHNLIVSKLDKKPLSLYFNIKQQPGHYMKLCKSDELLIQENNFVDQEISQQIEKNYKEFTRLMDEYNNISDVELDKLMNQIEIPPENVTSKMAFLNSHKIEYLPIFRCGFVHIGNSQILLDNNNQKTLMICDYKYGPTSTHTYVKAAFKNFENNHLKFPMVVTRMRSIDSVVEFTE